MSFTMLSAPGSAPSKEIFTNLPYPSHLLMMPFWMSTSAVWKKKCVNVDHLIML
jgi:hypothetical protein